ncbi:hypothetical protein Tco_0694262 [Tanacetum coccineum]
MIRRSNGVTNERSEVANEFSSIVSPSTPPGNDLNIAKESCSTWLDYVGPLITDELDSEKRWSYRDPKGNIQGGKKKEAKAFTFYRMEMEDISKRYDASCFVNALEAYDGEINLEHDKNLISNEFVVKLCLEHEVKNRDKVVKKELIVSLRGEIYFVKFIINPKEDDIEPGVVLGRSFLRLIKGIDDFGNGIITIYLDPEFSNDDDSDKANDSEDNWDVILEGIDFGEIAEIDGLELPPYLYNIGKSPRNKKKPKISREELEKDLWERIVILNEPRPIIETLKYGDRYKKVLDTILLEKLKLDDELRTKKLIKFILGGFEVYFQRGLRSDEKVNARDYWLNISRKEALHLSQSLASTIRRPILRVLQKMITCGVCQRTTWYDKMQRNELWLMSMFEAKHQNGYLNVAWLISKWHKRKGFGSQRDSMICCGHFITRIAKRMGLLTDEVLNSLSATIYCRALDAITLKELIGQDGRLIAEDPAPGVP